MFLVLHQWICKAQYPWDLKGILATTTSCRVPAVLVCPGSLVHVRTIYSQYMPVYWFIY